MTDKIQRLANSALPIHYKPVTLHPPCALWFKPRGKHWIRVSFGSGKKKRHLLALF
ncbi:hypothetical protein [Pseudomonas sp. MAG002Y]|uniref:hypothetical protein n=1 Tax=Pseudomonas sp. MAG002Y TaxID=2678690 RepID=UPI001C60D958|nr:hypothetical protein [Pseudomonas sp. MAG002Y]MBW5416246.1 hypothetical protein [Pseudomonas sp. MAG002Y]